MGAFRSRAQLARAFLSVLAFWALAILLLTLS
jgi:preprotein translocase subunit SecE